MNRTTAQAPSGQSPESPAALQFGPFLLDRRGGRLLRDGQPIDLAPKPMAVLCYLAERPGGLVTKEELLDGVWGHRFVSESVLKVTVNALRQVLGEDAREAHWVQTVPRRGYRFHESVQVLADRQPALQAVGQAAKSAPTSGPSRLGNLPATTGPLIGRDSALAGLVDHIASHRLVTLVGPGGVGKTTLALAAAAIDPPAGGVWLVRLDELDQPQALGRAVARALGLADAAGESPEALANALAPLQLRLLLDNAEHLTEALAPQVGLWLQRAPHLSVLVTSQRALQSSGEQVWPLAPLALPDASADAQSQAASPAVALMVQRVQALRPGWQPGAADLAELAAIARALDGLPLALELAAMRVPLLGAAGVRQRLDARLQMLTGGRADVPSRHRTLRASLEWTCGLLPPLPARALERLAVFVGGFTADAAQAVLAPGMPGADEWAILDALQLLQDTALLAAPDVAALGSGSQSPVPRMRLLDSVRLYGLERLTQSGDLAAAQADHRSWMLHQFLAAEEAYLAMGIERWLLPLEAEGQNLVAAMERGLQALEAASAPGRDAVEAPSAALAIELASLAAASTNFCLRSGLGRVLKQWRDRIDTWTGNQPIEWPRAVQARWCLGGAMLGGQGLLSARDALALGEKAVSLLADVPKRRQLALYVTGLFQLRLGEHDALAGTLAEMRRVPPAAASPYVGRLRPMLEASLAQSRGDQAGYLAYWTDALAESRALGDRFEAWRAAWGVGQARFLQGELDAAVAVMDQACDEVRAAGRLHSQSGMFSQAVCFRLARDARAGTLTRLREVVPVLQSQGILLSALGDALAWVPLWQGRRADALRIQAWVDACIATDKEVRSHIARRLRERFADVTEGATPMDAAPLDEAGALRLALGDGR